MPHSYVEDVRPPFLAKTPAPSSATPMDILNKMTIFDQEDTVQISNASSFAAEKFPYFTNINFC